MDPFKKGLFGLKGISSQKPVTMFCWLQNHYIGDFFRYVGYFSIY